MRRSARAGSIGIAKIANYRFEDLVADANPIAAARFGRLDELS
jgi:uric acid transporter